MGTPRPRRRSELHRDRGAPAARVGALLQEGRRAAGEARSPLRDGALHVGFVRGAMTLRPAPAHGGLRLQARLRRDRRPHQSDHLPPRRGRYGEPGPVAGARRRRRRPRSPPLAARARLDRGALPPPARDDPRRLREPPDQEPRRAELDRAEARALPHPGSSARSRSAPVPPGSSCCDATSARDAARTRSTSRKRSCTRRC